MYFPLFSTSLWCDSFVSVWRNRVFIYAHSCLGDEVQLDSNSKERIMKGQYGVNKCNELPVMHSMHMRGTNVVPPLSVQYHSFGLSCLAFTLCCLYYLTFFPFATLLYPPCYLLRAVPCLGTSPMYVNLSFSPVRCIGTLDLFPVFHPCVIHWPIEDAHSMNSL